MMLAAELRPSYPGSNSEVCSITAKAESMDDPAALDWTGFGWSTADMGAHGRREKKSREEIILLHDRSALHDPRSLVASLEAKWEGYRGEFTVRVTKKFPDVFAAWCKALPPEVAIELRGELQSLAAETVVGLTDAFKPFPERRGLYRPTGTAGVAAKAGATTWPKVSASAGLRA